MKTIIKESHFSIDNRFGWGNGYVILPADFPPFNTDDVHCHGGITFDRILDKSFCSAWQISDECIGCRMIGFDTCHFGDTMDNWPKERVLEEANNLADKLKTNLTIK